MADCEAVWHAGDNSLAGCNPPVSVSAYRVGDFQEGLQALRQFTLPHVKDRVEPSERDTLVLALFAVLSLFFPFYEFPEDDREPVLTPPDVPADFLGLPVGQPIGRRVAG